MAIVSPAYGIQTRYELLMMQNKFTLEKEQCLLKYEMLFVCSKAYTIVNRAAWGRGAVLVLHGVFFFFFSFVGELTKTSARPNTGRDI